MKSIFERVLIGFSTLSFLAITNCNVGLGESVDTQTPTIEITYPPIASVVRDTFTLYGTWDDDKGIESIAVTVIDTTTKNEVDKFSATVNSDKTWKVDVNPYVEDKYKYLDGTYQISVVATDGAGHKSGDASRTFDIDNTAPLFVISNPGVVKSSGKDFSEYGSLFNIEGTISDLHTIDFMNVDVFDENGQKINNETFIEKDIATAGGTNVTIASFNADNNSETKSRYSEIYGTDSGNGTKKYTCLIKLSDSAKVYQNPNETENNSIGNETTSFYLYDDVYKSLISSTKGFGYSYAQLMNIISGTLKDTNSSSALEILNEKKIDTSKSDEQLCFSLNPLANPTYTVNGFNYDFSESATIQSASAGNSLSVTLQAGLDKTNITPSSAKLWLLQIDERTFDKEKIKDSIRKLEDSIKQNDRKDAQEESKTEYKVCEFSSGEVTSGTSIETSLGKWSLIYENSSYNGSSVANKTFSVTIPANSISLNKYYFVAITGTDEDDFYYSVDAQNTIFGFEGNEAGVAPTVEIKSPNNLATISSTSKDTLTFSGRVYINSASLYTNSFKATINVKDENTSQEVGSVSKEIKRISSDSAWESSDAVSIDENGNWTIIPENFDGYETIKALKDSEKAYLYTLEIDAKSSSGHKINVSSMVHIDTTAPVVNISSVTPTVEGSEFYSNDPVRKNLTFINGSVNLKGSVEEINLEEVTYDVRARILGSAPGDMTENDSILAAIQEQYPNFNGKMGKVYSASLEIPTNAISWQFIKVLAANGITNPDPDIEFEIIVTAKDTCGNVGSYSTKELNGGKNFVIKQETDLPQISLGNASASITDDSGISESAGNLFGVTNNNKLSVSYSDDDEINNYLVTVKPASGAPSTYSGENIGKTSASQNCTLPKTEGVYDVEVIVYDGDYIKDGKYLGSRKDAVDSMGRPYTDKVITLLNAYRVNRIGPFKIAVDSGAPTLTVASPSNGSYVGQGNEINVSGTVSKREGVKISGFLYKTGDASNHLVELNSDSITIEEPPVNDVYNWSGKFTMPSNADGNYKLQINVTDNYQQNGSLTVNLGVDITPPELTITNATTDIDNIKTLITEKNPNYKANGYEHVSPLTGKIDGYMVSGKWSDSQTGTNKLYFQFKNDTNDDWLSEPKATGNVLVDYQNQIREVTGVAQSTGESQFSFYVPVVEGNSLGIRIWAIDGAGNSTTPEEGKTLFNLKVDLHQPEIKLYKDSTLATEITGNSEELKNVSEFYAKFDDTNIPESSVDAFTTKTISQGTLSVESFDSSTGVAKFTASDITDETIVTVTLQGTDTRTRKSSERKLLISEDKTAPRVTLGTYDKNLRSTSLELSGTVTDANFSTGSGYFVVKLIPPTESGKTTKTGNLSFTKNVNDYTWTANFNGLEDVVYDIAIEAKDMFDNKSAYSTKSDYVADNGATVSSIGSGSFSIDTKAPDSTIKISSHKSASPKLLNSAKGVVDAVDNVYTLDFGKTYYTNGKFTLGGVITENNLVTDGDNKVKFTVSREGAAADEKTLTFAADNRTWSYEIPADDEDGSYEYKLVLNDTAGNTFEKSVTVVIDTANPTITFTSPSNEESFESAPTAKVAFSDDGVGIEDVIVVVKDITGTEKLLVKDTDYEFTKGSATGTLNFKSGFNSEGTFTIEVFATDYLGFASDSSDDTKRTIFYDKNKPTVTETKIGNSTLTTNAGEITLIGAVSDTNALFTTDSEIVKISATVGTEEKSWSATINKTDKKNATWTYTFVTDKKEGVTKSEENYLPDGNYTFSIVAKDTAKKTNQISRNVNIDTKAPKFGNGTFSESNKTNVKPYVTTASVTASNREVWYKTNDIRIMGTASDENGTGIASVSYKTSVNGTNWSDAVDMAGTTSFNGTISGVESQKTCVKLIVKDNAGNTAEFTENLGPWNIDTTKPNLTDGSVKVGFAENPTEDSASFLANGKKDIYISGEISDEENGSGIDKVIILPYNTTSYDENSDKADLNAEKNGFSFKIPSTNVKQSGSVFARIYDVAGNYNDVNLFSITLDNKDPSVVLNKPADADTSTDELEINGTISLAGTASDDYTVSKIEKIQYVKSETAPTDSTTWSDLTGVTIAGEYSFTVTGFNTKLPDGDGTYYLRAVGVDTAENIGYSEPVKVKIDQDSDRPKIKITNLTGSDGNYTLRQGTRSRISGTVTDDDGIEEFYISESPFTGTETKPTASTYSPNSGSFTFNPSADATAKKNVDGEKTVYIYVKDKAGGVFYTTAYIDETVAAAAKYLKNPKIFLNDTAIAETENAKVFKYFSDSISPIVGTVTGLAYKADGTTVNAGYNADTATYDKEESVGASFIIGGTERQRAKFTIKASDANGIAGMSLEISYKDKNGKDKKIIRATKTSLGEDSFTTEQVQGDFTGTGTNDSSDATWTTDLISFDDAATGNATLKVVPYDNSGLSGNGSFTFVLDMTGPTIKVTSPGAADNVSGNSVTVIGVNTDNGGSSVDSIQWYIPTKAEVLNENTNWNSVQWKGNLSGTSSVSAWQFNFDDSDNDSFKNYTNPTDDKIYHSDKTDDGVYTLPLYLKATDKLGNTTISRDFNIHYNPDSSRPISLITYPGETDRKLKSDGVTYEDYAILGGTIRMTGSVEIPDGTTSSYKVFVQIALESGSFDDSTYADGLKDSGSTKVYKIANADSLEARWKSDYSREDSLNFSNDSSNSTLRSKWWGIEATKTSNSWYINLNSKSELNPTGETANEIKVRVCGVNAEGEVGSWSKEYKIHVDSNIPKYSSSIRKYNTSSTVALSDFITGTNSFYTLKEPSAVKDYVADMYLKGQWWIFAKITDDSAVRINGVKRGTTSLTYGTDYFVYPEIAGSGLGASGNSSTHEDGYVDGSGNNDAHKNSPYVAFVWVKVDKDRTTTQTYTIEAQDSEGTPNIIRPAFELNTDNKAPEMTALKDSYDSGAKEIAMTKIRNSNKSVSFSTTATDTGSGFDKLAFYFKRTVDSKTTIELPTPKTNGAGWQNDSSSAYVGELTEKDEELLTDSESNELYGVNLTGTTSDSTFTVTSPADISSYKFIRKGGLIKLSGVYYVISDVSGNAITVAENLSTSPTSAFVAAAMVLDHVSTAETPVWNSGVCTIAGDDDGDGFVEYIKKSGATWTLQADIFSDLLEDGPVTLVTMAFDKAENVTTTTTDLMIANNAPRLAKVYLATDLNGDSKFTDNELGSSLIKNENTTQKFYSALTNGTEGNVQEIVTISANNDGKNTGITMRDTLGVAFEWVSGYEGYGSGNGDIYYKLGISNAAIDKPSSGTELPKIADMSSKFDTTVGSVTASVSTAKLKGLTVTPATVKATSYVEYVSEKEATASNQKNEAVNFINLTLWDSTTGTTAGTGDTVVGGKITAFGSQYTVLNIPLYMDLVDGAKPTPKFSSLEAESATTGHVDLRDTLPSTYFKNTNTGLFDRDSKASGKVVFTGTVNDEKRITELNLKTSKTFANGFTTANSNVKVAEFKDGSLVATTAATSNSASWKFEITKEQFTTAEGHTVEWKLTVDTSKVAGVANSDVKFTITANDETNNATDEYQVDVVPYITGITGAENEVYRSRFGSYSVVKGKELTVSGYNLCDSSKTNTVKIGANTTVSAKTITDDKSFKMTVPEYSGELTVTVNNIVSLNDKNSNKELNNQEETEDGTCYDNRYLHVWDIGHTFKDADDTAHKPIMAADYNGNLYGQWTLMGAGQVSIQKSLTGSSRAAYVDFDQPAEYTALSIDTKSNANATGMSLLTIAEHVGNGGIMPTNGFAHWSNAGGTWGTNLQTDWINDESKLYNLFGGSKGKTKTATISSGNNTVKLDGDNTVSGFALQNYAMVRDVQVFSTPRTARFKNVMHYAYYDSKDKSLRYTMVNLDSETVKTDYKRYEYRDSKDWVLIDGNPTGIDRTHGNDLIRNDFNSSGDGSGNGDGYPVTVIGTGPYTVTFGQSMNVSNGDTIAIIYTTSSGKQTVDFLTANTNSSGTIATATGKFNGAGNTTLYAAVYKGASNAVSDTENVNHSSQAGKYIGFDVNYWGKPVIAYYDGANMELRIAYTDSTTPSTANAWSRRTVKYTKNGKEYTVTGGSHCSLKVGKDNNNADILHISYRDKKGNLMYIRGEGSTRNGFTFSEPIEVDSNTTGTYGTISLRNGTQPVISYLNSEESSEGVKIAILKDIDEGELKEDGSSKTSSKFDYMVVPVESGYNAVGENLISVEANTGNWSDTVKEDSISVKECEAVVGYQSTRFDVVFLKSEK